MAVTFHDFAGTIQHTNTGVVTYGAAVAIDDIVGVAMGAGTNTELTYKVEGLCKGLTKSTAAAMAQGGNVYFNGTAWTVATATTTVDGWAYAAATAGATTCDVVLTPGNSQAVS